MHKRDLLPAFKQSGANFNTYQQYSWIIERAALLKVFYTAPTKRLLTQGLLQKYEVDH